MNLPELSSLPLFAAAGSVHITDVPLSNIVFVAFDTETTGLSAITSRLVELCGVKFTADGLNRSTFRTLIDPQVRIPAAATKIHTITDEMVHGAPTYEQIVPEFIEWATDSENWGYQDQNGRCHQETVWLAHNAGFDVGFLEVALCKMRMPVPINKILDTLTIAKALVEKMENYRLRTLVEQLLTGEHQYHRALADSMHVKNLFLELLKLLPKETTLGDLAYAARHFLDRSEDETHGRWKDSEEVRSIKDAITGGNQLRLRYAVAKGSERIVTPRSVLFARGKPYLTAYCHKVSAERTFRVDKIIKLETVEVKP